MSKAVRYSPGVWERAVREGFARKIAYDSEWAAIRSIAEKFGCKAETLRLWVRRPERDSGMRAGPTKAGRARPKALERENAEP